MNTSTMVGCVLMTGRTTAPTGRNTKTLAKIGRNGNEQNDNITKHNDSKLGMP